MALKACLDTRFYFAYYARNAPAWTRKLVADCRSGSSQLLSSTITVTELISSMTPSVGLDAVRVRLDSARDAGVKLVPPSAEIASQAGELLLREKGLPVADAIIAATALAHAGGRVYTDDSHFDTVPGLHIVWGRT